MGVTGKVRADDDDGGDDDGGDDAAINQACQTFCSGCKGKPRGAFGRCMSACKRCSRKGLKPCGSCSDVNSVVTCCLGAASCCAATKTTNAYCANFNTDAKNCGKCGTACTSGTRPGCCAGKCTDLATDAKNCGRCGRACTSGTTPACCTHKCTDLATDAKNCGKCGTVCSGSTPNCKAGKCSA
jgi:hypothetical protein